MEATVSKMEIVQLEGDRRVSRKVEFYNLDAIISVGYRVNSALERLYVFLRHLMTKLPRRARDRQRARGGRGCAWSRERRRTAT